MVKQKKHDSYKKGDWFAVPLRSSGFAIGIVVEGSVKSGILLGYFFGPKYDLIPTRGDVQRLRPETADLIARFGGLGLAKGIWPVICSSDLDNFEWPVPKFVRHDPISGRSYTVTYDPSDLAEEVEIHLALPNDVRYLPKDGLSGYGAIEIKLTKLLENKANRSLEVQ